MPMTMTMTMTMRVARWVEYLQGVPKTQMHPWRFPLELFLCWWSTPPSTREDWH